MTLVWAMATAGMRDGRPMRSLVAATLLVLAGVSTAAEDDLLAVAPEQLPSVWKLEQRDWVKLVDPHVAEQYGCAAVSFIIEPDGSTSGFRLLRGVPEGDFAEPAKRVVGAFPSSPGAQHERAAVFTYLTISFNAAASARWAATSASPDCRFAPEPTLRVEGFDFGANSCNHRKHGRLRRAGQVGL